MTTITTTAADAFKITSMRHTVALEALILQAAQEGHFYCVYRTHPDLVASSQSWLTDRGYSHTLEIEEDGSVLIHVSWFNPTP